MTSTNGYVPGLRCEARALVIRERRLPGSGLVSVKPGDRVTGTMALAEAIKPGQVQPINLAGMLGCNPQEIGDYMKLRVGESVEKGGILAETPGLFGLFKARVESPVAGVLESVSEVSGQVMVREPPQPTTLQAYLEGRVLDVFPEGARIATVGTFIQGILGVGGEAVGTLMAAARTSDEILDVDGILPEYRGAILFSGAGVSGAALLKAAEIGVAGIIVGSIEARDLRSFLGYDLGVVTTGDEVAGPTVILTEGFGRLSMAESTFAFLRASVGRMASINGATQIRAGVIRPEIIIPCADWEARIDASIASRKALEKSVQHGFQIGSRVRVIREPGFGKVGIISGVPKGTQRIETEALVRVVELTVESTGEKITLPRAHVELMQQ